MACLFYFVLVTFVFLVKNKIIPKMFFIKNNLSYFCLVIVLGIFLKRIAFVLGNLF